MTKQEPQQEYVHFEGEQKPVVKIEPQMMICSKGHTLLLGTLYCLNKQCPDYKCVSVVDKCVHCIPVEPQPEHCKKGHDTCYTDCSCCPYWIPPIYGQPVEPQRYKCLGCGRDKFTRPNEPHTCNGQFRKHGLACIPVEPEQAGMKYVGSIAGSPELDVVGLCRPECAEPTCPADLQPEPTCQHTWSWAEGQTHEVCSKCGEIGEQVMDNAKVEIAAILRKYDCLMIPVKDKQLKEQLLAVLHTPADLNPAEPRKTCKRCGKDSNGHVVCDECWRKQHRAEPQAEMPLRRPENPYPKDIFPMTTTEYVEAVPDDNMRTAISGCIGRYVWNVCCEDWEKLIQEWLPAHDQQVRKAIINELELNIKGILIHKGAGVTARELFNEIIYCIRAMAEEE